MPVDRADFSPDMHPYIIDGDHMEEGVAIDYLIAQGMGIHGAYQYLRSLIQKLNAHIVRVFDEYDLGVPDVLPDHELLNQGSESLSL